MKILFIIISLGFVFSNNISGVAYFNYSEDSGFGLSRTYFTYKSEISDELSFKFQTDIGQLSESEGDPAEDYRWTAYLKKAQLDWKVNDGMKISMGMIGMNMFNVQEKTWRNRFVAKSALDYADWGVASADLGIGLSKSFGKIFTSIFITNGEGYKNSNTNNKTKISFQLLFGEKRLDKKSGYNFGIVRSSENKEINNEQVNGIFGGWSNNNLIIGIESYNKLYYKVADHQERDTLTSGYLNYIFNNDFSIFVRKDSKEINEDTNQIINRSIIAGFIWTPTKGLDICPTLVQIDDDDSNMMINFQFKF